MDEKAIREKDLQFLMLCGPLEDAIDLIDDGKVTSARALLERMLDQARRRRSGTWKTDSESRTARI